jgi:hypothetical protein
MMAIELRLSARRAREVGMALLIDQWPAHTLAIAVRLETETAR